ncbi:GatB/YqeY [Patescibacteria group bacterium]|nr:MAG: GatB/YqeY [Patescibacteria group bacterium]
MALKEQINSDLKAALLGGDRFTGEVLRGLKSVILDEEVKQNKRDEGLDDSTIEQLIAREIKKRNDSATQYEAAGRPELSETELKEAAVIASYLPAQVSEDEILVVIKKTIDKLGVTNMAGVGQVIGAVKAELGNSADGSTIARLVKDALQ